MNDRLVTVTLKKWILLVFSHPLLPQSCFYAFKTLVCEIRWTVCAETDRHIISVSSKKLIHTLFLTHTNWSNNKAKHTLHTYTVKNCVAKLQPPVHKQHNIFSGINSSFNKPNVIPLFLKRAECPVRLYSSSKLYMICIYEIVEMTVCLFCMSIMNCLFDYTL